MFDSAFERLFIGTGHNSAMEYNTALTQETSEVSTTASEKLYDSLKEGMQLLSRNGHVISNPSTQLELGRKTP